MHEHIVRVSKRVKMQKKKRKKKKKKKKMSPVVERLCHPRVNNLLYLSYNEENNNIQKHSLNREFFIFCVKQCEVIFFLNSATHAPGVQTGQAPEPGSLAPLQIKLSRLGERLQDHWSSGLCFTIFLYFWSRLEIPKSGFCIK